MDKKLVHHIRSAIIERERKRIHSLKAQMDQERTWSDRLADKINDGFGSMGFFAFHGVFFTGWILLNIGWIPKLPIFDPFPFGLLTMIVSLEAIFLSIFVLISQNRASKVAELREEIDLQVNVRAEQEITRLVIMVAEIHDKLGLPSQGEYVKKMMKETNINQIKKDILAEIEKF